jgi:hypothetical protein
VGNGLKKKAEKYTAEYNEFGRGIGSVTGLDIIDINVVVRESIWEEQCGVGIGIKQKAERYIAEIIECG